MIFSISVLTFRRLEKLLKYINYKFKFASEISKIQLILKKKCYFTLLKCQILFLIEESKYGLILASALIYLTKNDNVHIRVMKRTVCHIFQKPIFVVWKYHLVIKIQIHLFLKRLIWLNLQILLESVLMYCYLQLLMYLFIN